MRFLIDRCAGQRLTDWLTAIGHDAKGAWDDGLPDPGDAEFPVRREMAPMFAVLDSVGAEPKT